MDEATPTQLAHLMNVSRSAVYKAERDGRIQRKQNGLFDVFQTIQDWRANTDHRRGGKRIHSTDFGFPPAADNPYLIFWQHVFNQSAGALALALSERTTLTPKEVWEFLAYSFLLQWVVIDTFFGYGED